MCNFLEGMHRTSRLHSVFCLQMWMYKAIFQSAPLQSFLLLWLWTANFRKMRNKRSQDFPVALVWIKRCAGKFSLHEIIWKSSIIWSCSGAELLLQDGHGSEVHTPEHSIFKWSPKRALPNDNLNSPCLYNRMGLSHASVLWKDTPGLFCLEKRRGALCMSFRKDCREETWRRSTIKSRGDGTAFPHTVYRPLFINADTFFTSIQLFETENSWVFISGKWGYSHMPSKYRVAMSSETILCRNKIIYNSPYLLHQFQEGSQSLNQSVVRMSVLYPNAGDKFLGQSPEVCHPGGQSGHGDLCSVS